MRSSFVRSRSAAALSVAAATVAAAPAALAQTAGFPQIAGGTVTIAHNSNLGGTNNTRSVSFDAVGLPLNPSVSPFQLAQGSLSNGNAVSTARAGVSLFSSPTGFGLRVSPGSRVTQSGNTNPSAATASMVLITFETIWNIGANGFGPGLTAGGALSLAGTLGTGSNSFVQANLFATFDRIPGGAGDFQPIRSAIESSPFFRQTGVPSGPSNFLGNPSNFQPASPGAFTNNDQIRIAGTIAIMIHNEPGDDASTDFFFESAVPAPGAVALLGIAGIAAGRRRRR